MSGVVVTGASGFVGQAVMALAPGARALRLSGPDWRQALSACDLRDAAIVHLGARAHAADDRDAAFADGAEKARELALAAVRRQARVLVFASSIKVNGEETRGRPFVASDPVRPEDAYARSKRAAEEALAQVAAEHGLAVHVVRPPLVFGPGARGNLATLLRGCDSGWPLPFAAVHNRRSFIAVQDLARLLMRCAEEARPGMHTWLAAHEERFSTPVLLRELRRALGRAPRLVAVPVALLEAAARLAGQADRMRRLTRSLEVDAGATERALGWEARIPLDETLREMAAAWRARTP